MELKQGTLLKGGEFRILKALGHGGFGITYLAEQLSLNNRKVCIKEFFPSDYYTRANNTCQAVAISERFVADMEVYKRKFHKEATTIAALNHSNIIKIYDVFDENNTSYYAMEYIEGCSLRDMVQRGGALSRGRALKYIRQTALALAHIHKNDRVHLDIKPANIMVRDEDDSAIVIDFGLSKHFNDDGSPTSTTPGGFSRGYTPLEMYQTQKERTFYPATDIYSLGATLYTLLTGDVPPEATDISLQGLPSQLNNVDADIYNVISAAMEPNPQRRPQNITAFLRLLDVHYKEDDDGTKPENIQKVNIKKNVAGASTKSIVEIVREIVDAHFTEAGKRGIIIKTNRKDVLTTTIYVDNEKAFEISSSSKEVGGYRVYTKSVAVTEAITKLCTNTSAGTFLPGKTHKIGNSPENFVTVISTVLEEIDENIKSSRISSEVHIRRRIFSHLLMSLLTTVAVGVSAALLGAICGEMNNIRYDEALTIGLMSAPIFFLLYSLFYRRGTDSLTRTQRSIKTIAIVALSFSLIWAISALPSRSEVESVVYSEFGDTFTKGENDCENEWEIDDYCEEICNDRWASDYANGMVWYLIIFLTYAIAQSLIVYKDNGRDRRHFVTILLTVLAFVLIVCFSMNGDLFDIYIYIPYDSNDIHVEYEGLFEDVILGSTLPLIAQCFLMMLMDRKSLISKR